LIWQSAKPTSITGGQLFVIEMAVSQSLAKLTFFVKMVWQLCKFIGKDGLTADILKFVSKNASQDMSLK
jgi:hypothetical protein